ncbi:hypothetical protein EBR96_07330, partial [bacterium]|nr:hypothetical protein [bacterium]
ISVDLRRVEADFYRSTTVGSLFTAKTSDLDISGQPQTIEVQSDSGTVYVFKTKIYEERWNNGAQNMANISVFYLDEIRDQYGNKIELCYEPLSPGSKVVESEKLSGMAQPVYAWLNKQNFGDGKSTIAKVFYYRPARIIDADGRRYEIGTDVDGTTVRVRTIGYINVNGGNNVLRYTYDSNGCLTGVAHNTTQLYTYRYQLYRPNYHLYFNPIVSVNGKLAELYLMSRPDGWIARAKRSVQIDDANSSVSRREGYLLTSVQNGLGGVSDYEYADTLAQYEVKDHGISVRYGMFGIRDVVYIGADYSGSMPVVVREIVKESVQGETKTTRYDYPVAGDGQSDYNYVIAIPERSLRE